MDHVRWVHKEDPPELRKPIMVVAFEGWNDAGEAASLAADHLAGVWDAEVVATIDSEEFYDFTVARPEITLDEQGQRTLAWPDPEILGAALPGSDHDLVILRGIEPHMRWKAFASAVGEVARTLGVDTVVLLGALLADVPHSRPAPVSGGSEDPDLSALLGLAASSYEGPTGIVGVLYDALRGAGARAASLWTSVPHYVHQFPSPKAALALLERLSLLLGVPIDLLELPEAAEEYEREVDEQIADDPDTVAYVAELEQASDAEGAGMAPGAEGAGTAPGAQDATMPSDATMAATVPSNEIPLSGIEGLAAEVERYLREHPSAG